MLLPLTPAATRGRPTPLKGKRPAQGLVYLLILGLAGLVLYLSWRSQPRMGLVWFLPRWLAHWADERANDAIRTAVPLVLLGLLVGAQLAWQHRPRRWWLAAWAALTSLVSVAEAGQLFLAHRIFDPHDIAWGSAGALAGLGIAAALQGARGRRKRRRGTAAAGGRP